MNVNYHCLLHIVNRGGGGVLNFVTILSRSAIVLYSKFLMASFCSQLTFLNPDGIDD